MVKIGLISLAHMHGLSYGRALQASSQAQFVGIYDRDEQRGSRYAKEFGVEYFSPTCPCF